MPCGQRDTKRQCYYGPYGACCKRIYLSIPPVSWKIAFACRIWRFWTCANGTCGLFCCWNDLQCNRNTIYCILSLKKPEGKNCIFFKICALCNNACRPCNIFFG